jgi:hypothetical protein
MMMGGHRLSIGISSNGSADSVAEARRYDGGHVKHTDAHHGKRIGMSGSIQRFCQPAVEKAASNTTEVLGPVMRPRYQRTLGRVGICGSMAAGCCNWER